MEVPLHFYGKGDMLIILKNMYHIPRLKKSLFDGECDGCQPLYLIHSQRYKVSSEHYKLFGGCRLHPVRELKMYLFCRPLFHMLIK